MAYRSIFCILMHFSIVVKTQKGNLGIRLKGPKQGGPFSGVTLACLHGFMAHNRILNMVSVRFMFRI